jgi:hypothetical protein
MSLTRSSLRRLRAARPLPRRRSYLERGRVTLGDGATTTLHVASYERSAFDVRVVVLEEPAPLVRWCAQQGVREAVVGGFFVRPDYAPLGQLRIAGEPRHPARDHNRPVPRRAYPRGKASAQQPQPGEMDARARVRPLRRVLDRGNRKPRPVQVELLNVVPGGRLKLADRRVRSRGRSSSLQSPELIAPGTISRPSAPRNVSLQKGEVGGLMAIGSPVVARGA